MPDEVIEDARLPVVNRHTVENIAIKNWRFKRWGITANEWTNVRDGARGNFVMVQSSFSNSGLILVGPEDLGNGLGDTSNTLTGEDCPFELAVGAKDVYNFGNGLGVWVRAAAGVVGTQYVIVGEAY